jgi:hypothetical protein
MLPIQFDNSEDTNKYCSFVLDTIEGGGLPLNWDQDDKYKFVDEHSPATDYGDPLHYEFKTLRNCAEIHAEHWSNYLVKKDCDRLIWARFVIGADNKIYSANSEGHALLEITDFVAIPRA